VKRRSLGAGCALAALALLTGCAPRFVPPLALAERRDPRPLLEALEAYNAGPASIRLQGRLKASGRGGADFGARVAAGVGLRFDAVAGPFGTPVLAVSCRTGDRCEAYVPSRRTVYVDEAGEWESLLAALLRGRVPVFGTVEGAWESTDGTPVLVFAGEGWEERVEFDPSGRTPERIFLGRRGERPSIRLAYSEFGVPVEGYAFPRRVLVGVREPEGSYEITVRRVEAAPGIEPGALGLALPPGTLEEKPRGEAPRNERLLLPFWFLDPKGPGELPENS
jgi:hypothetical protein